MIPNYLKGIQLIAMLISLLLAGCDSSKSNDSEVEPLPESAEPLQKVGFEILQIQSPSEIITWLNTEMTLEEFEAIALPSGWFKNQPREGDPDRGTFARSPSALADGEFVEQVHFGHTWRHVATITETNIVLDDQGLLSGNRITKFHEIAYEAGKTLWVIVSPDGESFVRVSRDAGRTSDVPTIPDSWQYLEYVISEELVIQLPNETLNIRADNEDSFQGPVAELDLGS